MTVTRALLAAPVRVGIDDGGSATVLWSEFGTVPSLTGPVRTATVTPAGGVAIHDIGGEVLPGSWLALAVGAAGQAVAAWSGFPGPPGQGRSDARVALRPAGGQFGAATTFADPAANLYMAGANIDGAGRATVAVQRARHGPWPPVAGDPGGVEILQGSADGGWGTPQGLDAGVQATNVRLVSNPRGDRAATWDVQPLNPREVGASRVAPAPGGQPFGPLLLTAMPVTADAIPGTSAGDVQAGAAVDGAGETLVLRDGPSRGMQIHPVSPTAKAGPAESVLANACAGGSGHLAVDASPPWPRSPITGALTGSGSSTATPARRHPRRPRASASCGGRQLCPEHTAPRPGPSGSSRGSRSRPRAWSSPCATATDESSHPGAWAPDRSGTRASPSAAAMARPPFPPAAIA